MSEKLLILFLCATIISSCESQTTPSEKIQVDKSTDNTTVSEKWIAFKEMDLVGYKTSSGEVVIPAEYEYLTEVTTNCYCGRKSG